MSPERPESAADRTETALVDYLLSPQAVRDRCTALFRLAEQDQLTSFSFQPEKLPTAARYVEAVIRANYPTLAVPYHSRWRHFDVGGIDRVANLQNEWSQVDKIEQGRRLYELAITSVLLDAGAGSHWKYTEPATNQIFTRSEGLAVASFDLFCQGSFSSQPTRPYQADGIGLSQFTSTILSSGFQVSKTNPLLGVAGRSQIMTQLGHVVLSHPEIFGEDRPRLGNLYDYFLGLAVGSCLSAVTMLKTVLRVLGEIWPGRIQLEGTNLGDCWRHPALRTADQSSELVPFHKLSQWLTYSLLEPLHIAGITITDLNDLTGLAEYRNGGLLLDLEVITLRDSELSQQTHTVDSLLIIEWRALTVAILDILADLVRENLGLSVDAFPLAKVLQGGTWHAGRQIAKEKRANGAPPLTIRSDGTVF